MYLFPPSSFHISNEGKKNTLTSIPLPLNNFVFFKKNQAAPFPSRTMNRI